MTTQTELTGRPPPGAAEKSDPPRPRRRPARPRRDRVAALLILPAFVLELLVHVAPVLLGVVISLLRLDQFNLRDWTAAPYTGLANYRTGLDPNGPLGSELVASAGRTALYAALVVGISWCLGLFAAVLLANPFRGRAFFQALFLVPFVLPAYATVLPWRFMFDRDTGVLNHLLVDDLHLVHGRPFWLIGGNAFWATVIVAVWRLWPFGYLVLAAALHTVPTEHYAAAAVDGAGAWQQFRRVTLPATRRASTLVFVLMGLWSLTDFSTPYLLFDSTPPPSATLLGNLIYRTAFADFDLGVASAMNVLVASALLVLAGCYACRRLRKAAADV